MQKITIAEAVKLVTTSESTIRRDIRKGKISAEKGRGRTHPDRSRRTRKGVSDDTRHLTHRMTVN